MKAIHYFAAIAVLPILLAGCGGGGDGGADVSAPPPPPSSPAAPVNTYGNTNLPGRLLIPSNDGSAATAYDLRTGMPATVQSPAGVANTWFGSFENSVVVRMTGVDANHLSLERVRTSDWTRVGSPVTFTGRFLWPKLSADKQYIMAFVEYEGQGANNTFTIFNASTGQVVKQGSQLNNEYTMASPATWLPDGSYVTLAGNKLYRSTLTTQGDYLIATLALPDNSIFHDGASTSRGVYMAASPDGTKIAFSWITARAGTNDDSQLWVVNVDGTGLKQLTTAPDATSGIAWGIANPMWSPDSQWVGGVNYMASITSSPIFPPNQSFPGIPGGITGTTGCGLNGIFVVPASARMVPISWPAYDVNYNLKVRNASGTGGRWLSSCTSAIWMQ